MNKFQNYALGQWISGTQSAHELFNAVTGESLGFAGSDGIDFKAMCTFARERGGPALRAMTFHERGRMLKALAMYLLEQKEHYYALSWATGA
ncbi:MAG: phenylacetic acid degradation bifunctional protein PaaZ, partial [Bacteroidia bacterium]|nr:phenylacetic acid degradation bifunctional protein PaaZ [Bacteroidia bacterium]